MPPKSSNQSAFKELGLKKAIASLTEEIVDLYLSDDIPWVIGYSGGKDSTATLQLVWLALSSLDEDRLKKQVYVISTDTLVENPIVAVWVNKSLEKMTQEAVKQGLPIASHRLTPEIHNTFWVNLIGKGYPAPRHKFRWCTERMKIQPSTQFIRTIVQEHGEAIVVLGTRKAESMARARVMNKFEKKRIREKLSPNGSLPNSYIYSPIEDWSNDDVWLFLMQVGNPWGYNNKDLLTMYQGASPDGECPLVVDTTTPSCGDSRFGCWVCTLVEKDKSMTAMIQNDDEKEWMLPLLQIRNELDFRSNESENDRHLRDFRRMSGAVQLFHDRPIPGPYKQDVRADWLRKVLEAQQYIRQEGPEEVKDIELISLAELEEIRRIWVIEKHEIEDVLPQVYKEAVGEEYPGKRLDDNTVFGPEEMKILRELCGESELHYQLARELLSLEKRYRSKLRRAGIFDTIESAFKKHFYENEEDAVERIRKRKGQLETSAKHVEQLAMSGGYIQDFNNAESAEDIVI